jgi:streptogramin lyase
VLLAAAATALLAAAAIAGLAMRGEGEQPRAPRSSTPAPKREMKVTATRVGGRPNIILGAGGHVWTGKFLDARLQTLDPATGDRTRPRPEIGVGLLGLAASGHDLWALAARDRQLVHLDARSGRRIGAPIPLPGTSSAVAATKDAVYVAVTQPLLDPGDQILVIDPRTGAIRQTIETRDGVRRLEVFRGRLWVLASNRAELIGIDLDEPSHRRHVPLDSSTSVDLAVGAGDLWVSLSDSDQLARIDPRGGKPSTFATGRGPAGIQVRKGIVWVANRAESTLTRIDIRRRRPVDPVIPVPQNPYDVAAYGDTIWVTSLTEGKIARVTGLGD